MRSEDSSRTTSTPDPEAPGRSAPGPSQERPRRTLNRVDWLVRVPIGFLWLGVLAIAAVPVMIYMTVLYWAVHWTSLLFGGKRGPRRTGADPDTRIA